MKTSYNTVIGTGGIGTGIIFKLEGNHNLGRNESRMAYLSEQRDFCKQHIILHYVSSLLKQIKLPVKVFPIGAVGNDDPGAICLKEMKLAGMDTRFVRVLNMTKSLFAVCFQYPDNSGGNITQKQSASEKVKSDDIQNSFYQIVKNNLKIKPMILAAPEVPLASRAKLLKLGRKIRGFNAASFSTEEIKRVKNTNILKDIDLLSLNMDEANALAGTSYRSLPDRTIKKCCDSANKINPGLFLTVTNGSRGIYGCRNRNVEFIPALRVKVANTAGAGDAFLAGIMLGFIKGLPFISKAEPSCLKLGRLISAISVTSPHTIHFGLNLKTLREFAKEQKQTGIFNSLVRKNEFLEHG
ncbi:MAG: PfkB family carbohydrate kinase [bacterium]